MMRPLETHRLGRHPRAGVVTLALVVGALAWLTSQGCDDAGACRDVGLPNATVTEVAHDHQARLLFVAVTRAASFCDGGAGHPFRHELVTVDLTDGSHRITTRGDDSSRGFATPSGDVIFRGGFAQASVCADCELILRPRGLPAYTYRFHTPPDAVGQTLMTLEVTANDYALATLELRPHETTALLAP